MESIHRARLLLLPEEGKGRLHGVFGFAGIIREMNTNKVLSLGISEQSRKGGQFHYCRLVMITLHSCLPNELKRCKRP